MEDVEITGIEQGYIGESIPFTATISPVDATTPITYTWEATGLPPVQHVGDGTDTIEFAWDEIGTKIITVTAANAGGILVDTHTIDIEEKVPIVSISGPTESLIGNLNVFTATVLPTDVVLPITYTWQASGQFPITNTTGLSDMVSFTWDMPGTQVITVTAENIVGSTTDTFALPVRVAPSNLEVTGPDVGGVNTSYIFTAIVSPITTTVPITYVWTVDGQITITDTVGIIDSVSLSWDQPGLHQISVLATNQAGQVIDTWTTTLYFRSFLPISMRH